MLWYQVLMMQSWLFTGNTGAVSDSRGPDQHLKRERTVHSLLGGPACRSWKSRLLGDTTSHSHPAPVLRGLVQLYNTEAAGGVGGWGVSWKHALSLLGSENNADWHTHKHGLVAREGGVRSECGIYDMTSPDRVMECCVMLCLVFQH